MATKTKTQPQPVAAKKTVEPARPFVIKVIFTEICRHPSLATAVVFLILTAFSIAAVIQFKNDMNMGAIREPTGTIFLAAMTVTLFASYWRQRSNTNS